MRTFTSYLQSFLSEALDDMGKGILINGHRLNNIKYADDTYQLCFLSGRLIGPDGRNHPSQQSIRSRNQCK